MRGSAEGDFAHEQFRRFYIAGGYGPYADAWERFKQQHPDMVEAIRHDIDQSAVNRLRREFRAADREEDGHPPFQPKHLRQGFLDLGIELPPMTASIDEGSTGRIAADKATPQQHRAAHASIRDYHARGFRYRDQSVKKWDDLHDSGKLSEEQWEEQSLFELVEGETVGSGKK